MRTITLLAAVLLSFGTVTACGGASSTPAAPTASDAPATEGRRIDVAIDERGYAPDLIQAAAGEDLTLVFSRKDEANCGETVQFPDQPGVEAVTVPVGTEVAVNLKMPASGELAFTCGMGMYKGAIVVRANL